MAAAVGTDSLTHADANVNALMASMYSSRKLRVPDRSIK